MPSTLPSTPQTVLCAMMPPAPPLPPPLPPGPPIAIPSCCTRCADVPHRGPLCPQCPQVAVPVAVCAQVVRPAPSVRSTASVAVRPFHSWSALAPVPGMGSGNASCAPQAHRTRRRIRAIGCRVISAAVSFLNLG